MEELPLNLKEIINNGENISVEFKAAEHGLPKNLFDTICAMLNRCGGHIFLGVSDNGQILGIEKNIIKKIKKDFSNNCHNSTIITPTIHLELEEYKVDNKTIMYLYIYESSDVHRSKNKIFDRNVDGDYDITSNTNLVSELYIRKNKTYFENTIYPYATLDDLNKEVINKVRKRILYRNSDHPWGNMNDLELLKSAGLYDRDLQTGKEGINLAGILLFGKDETIYSALSHYKTNALLKVENVDRYDDREDIRTNLIDSYEILMDFVKKHLNEKFYLEGDQNISVRDKISREVCANLLIHREYSNPYPAELVITKDKLITTNANKPRTIGYIDLNNYTPYPKNPKIARVFKEIGYADELGTGIRNIVKYTQIYSGGIPKFKDADIFTTEIPVNENNDLTIIDDTNILKNRIMVFIEQFGITSRKDINNYFYPLLGTIEESKKNNKIRTALTELRKKEKIINIGTDSKPKWTKKVD